MDKQSDKIFEVLWNGKPHWVVANWYEARRYHLTSYCESCGLVWKSRGRHPSRLCPGTTCWSDATRPLWQVWDDLRDPWDSCDSEADADEIEQLRITNVL